MDILFERRLFLRFDCKRYLVTDSSPQLGHNFQCVREDRFIIPNDLCADIVVRAKLDIGHYFETRICPLSTFGAGRAGVRNHLSNWMNIPLMETDSKEGFEATRGGVVNTCSDQGTEKDLNDAPFVLKGHSENLTPGSPESFTYPNSLYIPGHLHILFNALEEACKAMPVYKVFIEALRALQDFLSDPKWRKKFQATCMAGDARAHMFDHYHVVHIDWRWEFLSRALDKLLVILSIFAECYDEAKILSSESSRPLTSHVVKSCTDALLGMKNMLPEIADMLRAHGKALERFAHRLEGCFCHQEIWLRQRTSTKRRRGVTYPAPIWCVWKGRMGPYMAAEGLDVLLQEIGNAETPELRAKLDAVGPVKRAILLKMQADLRTSLQATLTVKFDFWRHTPWKALAGFYTELGGWPGQGQTHAERSARRARCRGGCGQWSSVT